MTMTMLSRTGATTLRAVSYLAPGLPEAYFHFLAEEIGRGLGCEVALQFDASCSGPNPATSDPFARGLTDIGFLCAPSYVHLASADPPSVVLVPAAPVFADPRCAGRPVYFSEVIVRRDDPASCIEDLVTRRWSYNDASSLSGYYSVLISAAARGIQRPVDMVASGSHARSVELVALGTVDAAAIDSNSLHHLRSVRPDVVEQLRVVDTLGPYPVQPVVIRAGLGEAMAEEVAGILVGLHEHAVTAAPLADFGVARFAVAPDAEYHTLRLDLARVSTRPMATARSPRDHWDGVYERQGDSGVSWYQSEPVVTLGFFDDLGIGRHAGIVDIGGGASVLADHLIDTNHDDVSVLDISKVALEDARKRLGPRSASLTWLHEDIFEWSPPRRFDVWHDRAVFHFLIDEGERDLYREVLRVGGRTGGIVIMATFAPDGPPTCSGLPVVRYGAEELAAEFALDYALVATRREEHVTPRGTMQPFTWVAMRHTGSSRRHP